MRLLLIEDDPHLPELIPKALRAKGFAVDVRHQNIWDN
jgi:DNA-binding response OmpR family regulator